MPSSKDPDKNTPDHLQNEEKCELEELQQLIDQQRIDQGIVPQDFAMKPPRPATPPPISPEDQERHRQSDAELERRRVSLERWNRWVSLCGERGERYADCSLATYDAQTDQQKTIVGILREYCQVISAAVTEGRGVLLFGPCGSGKDHLAMAVCRAMIGADVRVRWQNGMDLFGDIRDSMDSGESERDLIDRLVKPTVLYLSDPLPPFGALTQFQSSMLFRILDGRYSRKRPLIVTVNADSRDELDDRMGAQNSDRLRDGALALFCDWESYRKVAN